MLYQLIVALLASTQIALWILSAVFMHAPNVDKVDTPLSSEKISLIQLQSLCQVMTTVLMMVAVCWKFVIYGQIAMNVLTLVALCALMVVLVAAIAVVQMSFNLKPYGVSSNKAVMAYLKWTHFLPVTLMALSAVCMITFSRASSLYTLVLNVQ